MRDRLLLGAWIVLVALAMAGLIYGHVIEDRDFRANLHDSEPLHE